MQILKLETEPNVVTLPPVPGKANAEPTEHVVGELVYVTMNIGPFGVADEEGCLVNGRNLHAVLNEQIINSGGVDFLYCQHDTRNLAILGQVVSASITKTLPGKAIDYIEELTIEVKVRLSGNHADTYKELLGRLDESVMVSARNIRTRPVGNYQLVHCTKVAYLAVAELAS